MAARIKSALRERTPTRTVRISVEAHDRIATLGGVVDNAIQRTQVEGVVQGVAGVMSVENNLRSRDDSKRRLVD